MPDDLIRVRYSESGRRAARCRVSSADLADPRVCRSSFVLRRRSACTRPDRGLQAEQRSCSRSARGRRSALVLPLPPHVMERLPRPGGSDCDRRRMASICRRRCGSDRLNLKIHNGLAGRPQDHRRICSVVVFEAYRKDGEILSSMDQAVADVIDPRIIPATSKLDRCISGRIRQSG